MRAKRDGQRGMQDQERLFLKDGRQFRHTGTLVGMSQSTEKKFDARKGGNSSDVFSNLQSMLILLFHISSTLDIIY